MSPKGIVTVGLCLFACLYAATLWMRTGGIENDLTVRAAQALRENGLDSVSVTLDGRDVTLAGIARESSAAKALQLVASVWGVRIVASDIDTVAAENAHRAEQARAKAARLTELARLQETREAQAARLAEQARAAEAAKREAERLTEQVRREQARKAEAIRLAEQARLAREAATTRLAVARSEGDKPAARHADEPCGLRLREFLADKIIQFETGGAEISSHGVGLLGELSRSAQECPHVHIEIIGHTDARGEPQANLDLSWRRAEAAVTVLARAGVARDRLSATGYGSDAPLASNATAEGRAKNRRIEFHVKQ